MIPNPQSKEFSELIINKNKVIDSFNFPDNNARIEIKKE